MQCLFYLAVLHVTPTALDFQIIMFNTEISVPLMIFVGLLQAMYIYRTLDIYNIAEIKPYGKDVFVWWAGEGPWYL